MKLDNNQQAFFELVRVGLWEKEVRLAQFEKINYQEVFRLAEEQSVIGLIAAGLDHVVDVKAPQEIVLQFVGTALQIEQQNIAMNKFLGELLEKLNKAAVDYVLIKGQGVAQCYERPLWRCSGDVDLLLNEENYEKGKLFIDSVSEAESKEYDFNKEFNTTIDGWCVELHGSLRCGLSAALNRGVDAIQYDICDNHHVRFWENSGMKIPLPEENDDVLVIFTHYIKHFYKGELGIRQICDWCRLLWTYRDTLNHELLESRLRKMGLRAQWKGFGAFAVDYLGMPVEAMPLYSPDTKWSKKADKICAFVLEVGNFGHNVDASYYSKFPLLIRKAISMWKRIKSLLRHASIFPWHTFRFMPHVIYTGLKATIENGTGYRQIKSGAGKENSVFG